MPQKQSIFFECALIFGVAWSKNLGHRIQTADIQHWFCTFGSAGDARGPDGAPLPNVLG